MDGRFGEGLSNMSIECFSFGVAGITSFVLVGLPLAGELGSELELGYSVRGVEGTVHEVVGELL